jgi:hypothetical protein
MIDDKPFSRKEGEERIKLIGEWGGGIKRCLKEERRRNVNILAFG